MDLLSQYKQEHPEAFQDKKAVPLTDEYGRVYTGMIGLVMRLSGGRIRDGRTASYALLAAAAVIVVIALYFFISGIGGGAGAPLPYEQTYQPKP
ncbi:MAG: hypothetical protein AAB533_02055 [Patescibacteria group bacterium]